MNLAQPWGNLTSSPWLATCIYYLYCMVLNYEIKKQTSFDLVFSGSSIWTTCPIVGLLSESRSTHLNATKRTFLRALEVGLITMLGSTTSSERRLAIIHLSQSTRFTCNHTMKDISQIRNRKMAKSTCWFFA